MSLMITRKKRLYLVFVLIVMLYPLVFAMHTEAAQIGDDARGGQEAEIQPVADGIYQIVSALGNDYVWDIADASLEGGANLQLYEKSSIDAQKFLFTYHSDGYYTITNVNSGKVVDCAGGTAVDGTNIWQYESNATSAQMWKLMNAGNGYYTFICKCNGMAVDVKDGIAANGTNLQMYHLNGTLAQQFKLVAAGRITGRNAKVFSAVPSYIVLIGMIVGGYYLNLMFRKRDGRENHVI